MEWQATSELAVGKSDAFLREQFAEGTLRLFAIPGFEGDVRVRIPRCGYESSHLLQEVFGCDRT